MASNFFLKIAVIGSFIGLIIACGAGISDLVIYGSFGLFVAFLLKRNSVWHVLGGWLVFCFILVFCTFWRFNWVIPPTILQGRSGSDGYIAASLGEWGLDYWRKGEKVPAWNPYICGGMPTVGSLLFAADYMPFILASVKLRNYRAEWDIPSDPIQFGFKTWVGNSVQCFFGPLALAIIVLYACWSLFGCWCFGF